MNTRRAIFWAAAAVFLLLAIVYLWGPSKVPPGQPPLLTLSSTNFSDFQNAFDAQTDVVRLVLLLSPT
ncbi:MAG TPA: hypothetical protein VM709_05880 [Candidatus Sulfotelmatobacter sp.]|jgi:hypothetical protein|nr:hypothetical protein [Candidatus Sulfotelmatobacter sp.]